LDPAAVAGLVRGLLSDDVAGRAAYESAAGLLPRLPDAQRGPLAEELVQHRQAVGRKRLDGAARRAVALTAGDAAGGALAGELDEIADWWLADEPAGRRQARAAAALARGRASDDLAAVAAQLAGEPPPLLAPLAAEYLRLAKPLDAYARLKPLWARSAALGEADRRAFRDEYVRAVRAAVRTAQDRPSPDWVTLAAALEDLNALAPGDASQGLAWAEAASCAADKPLPPERRAALSAAIQGAPETPYRTYVQALAAADPGETAAGLLKAYPEGQEPAAELRADFRRAHAARRLRAAARGRLTPQPPPLDDPLPDAAKDELADWLDRAAALSPPDVGDQAVRAIAAWPADAARARALTSGLSDDRIVRELGPLAAWVLWVKARSHAEGTTPAQLVALSAYERLGLLLREQYLRRAPDDPLRVSARTVAARALDPALALGERLAGSLPPEFKRRLAKLYAEKGRLVSAAARAWSADVRSAVVEAVAAFDAAIRYDEKSPASAAYLVEKALARGKEPRLAPPLDELNSTATRAGDLDPSHFLPAFLKARYLHLGGAEFARLPRDFPQAERLFQEALDAYNRARELIRESDHPDRPEYEADIIAGRAAIYAWLAQAALKAETRAEFRGRAAAAFDELAGRADHANAAAYDQAGRHFEGRGTPADFARADALYRHALRHADDAGYRVDLARATVKWVAYGGKAWSALDEAVDQLTHAIKQDDRTAHLAEAHFWLAQALRWQGRLDDAREQLNEASRRSLDAATYWSARVAVLADEWDLAPERRGGGAWNEVATALAGRRDDALRDLARRAAAYARLADGAGPEDVRDAAGVPPAGPTDESPESLARALPWVEALVRNDAPLTRDDPGGRLRRLADRLVASADRQDDPALAARAEFLAARLRLRLGTDAAARREALDGFARAAARLNPAAPLVAAWRESLARDLARLGRSAAVPAAARRSDLETAAALVHDARAHAAAPRTAPLERLAADIRRELAALP
jgi:tetratricopeptide (TPR) repeat protein